MATSVGGALTEIDRAIDRLVTGATAWSERSPRARAALLRACIARTPAVASEWAELGCRAKGIDPAAPLAGEEWLGGPMTTIRGFRLTAEALERLDGPESYTVAQGPGGRTVANVFPSSALDRVLYRGIRGDVWFRPGASPSRGRVYRTSGAGATRGGVAAVLGAGNVSSIGPLDALYMLAAEGLVVALKLNPVNAYLRPVFEHAFKPLIDPGFLAIVSGGGDVGEYASRHPAVSRVHLTGSRRTYDAIMWGADPEEQRSRKSSCRPRLDKVFTAELGCVTPILVVPGEWSEADLEFQARHVASTVAHNASFNCVAGKVLVVAREWPQRQAFLDRVERALARTAPRLAYYPGAHERYAAFLDRYPAARAVGPRAEGAVPWTVIPDVAPEPGEFALNEEAFCGVLAVTTIDGHDAPTFLARAVPFVNSHVDGTLSCMMLVHPKTAEAHRVAIESAEAGLNYGSIGVNVWSGVVFGIGATTWGAYPGHVPAAVGSGIGVVHNAFLFDDPEKSVVRAPFRMWPTPVWFADHRNLLDVGRRMTSFEADPSWAKLPGVFAAALRG